MKSISGCSHRTAATWLKDKDWDVDAAVNEYYESGAASKTKEKSDNLTVVFLKYVDEDSEVMETNGIISFCKDINVDPEDSVVLLLSYYMEAKQMMRYTKEEFICGFDALECSNITELKTKIPSLKKKLFEDNKLFIEVYNFTYDFTKNMTHQKTIAKETAISLWGLLLTDKFWSLKKIWFEYLTNEKEKKKGISKDEWKQLLIFIQNYEVIDNKIKDFDTDGAWPVLIDDFVEFLEKK